MYSDILAGKTYPLGATVTPEGVNFCIYSKNCQALELLLFDDAKAKKPERVIPLDPKINKTFFYWHIFVPGLKAGQIYAYRAYGIYAPEKGHRFDGNKILLDPYAKAIVGDEIYSREAAGKIGNNCASALKGVVVDYRDYDWGCDRPLAIPYSKTIIYELHVGGFTSHPNSGVAKDKRGTYAGLIEKIPYLKQLGITAVELMPIHQFDEQDAKPEHSNYWGYSTIGFFAPHRAYSSRRNETLGPVNEFRDMVKALHQAGLEVILDVVFNHTAEGNEQGPTLSFKGLENTTYYILDKNNPAHYSNYSGCGNTVKLNHPIVAGMIMDCLRYWVSEMHVDGFRFDLAAIMSRDRFGRPVQDSRISWMIETDPILAGTKLIAEAWDAAGLYQVGSFSDERFAEWNGPYRDDVRKFIKSDTGTVINLGYRLTGSPDIYFEPEREVNHSINFITCHDGFTLMDLVSYNQKHNLANGEDNTDGNNDNHSWNCGIEGDSVNPSINSLRKKQMKNLLTILLVSQGTPMLLMGDEIGRTQKGNNNAYCQNNEISWMNWDDQEKNADVLRFVKGLIEFIQELEIFQQERILANTEGKDPYIIWHGTHLKQQNWEEDSHSLAFELCHPDKGEHLYVILNSYWRSLTFELPSLPPGREWHRIVDTGLQPPWDFCYKKTAPIIKRYKYRVQGRSSVILIAKKEEKNGSNKR